MSSDFAFNSSKTESSIECFKDNNLKLCFCAKNWSMKALLKASQSTRAWKIWISNQRLYY